MDETKPSVKKAHPRGSMRMDQLFTLRQASELLQRTEFNVWHHAKNNLKQPVMMKGRNILLTKGDLIQIVEHLRLKAGESRDEFKKRINDAVAA
jgi:hypothetical protein